MDYPIGLRRAGAYGAGRNLMTFLRTDRLAAISVVVALAYIAIAIFAPILAPYPEQGAGASSLDTRLLPPSSAHLMGTDVLGRDILSRVLFGTRNALIVSFAVTGAAALIGTTIGAFAGLIGGWVDEVLMRITDVFLAFPSLLMAIAIVATIGPSFENAAIALAARWWTWYARIARATSLSLRERYFVEAARVIGVSSRMIVIRHLIPNSIGPIIVNASADLGSVILAAGGLAFLGLGATVPTPDWGLMIAEGRDNILTHPWIPLFPGLAMFIAVLAFNLLGDSLRDALDPRRAER
jgi:peptide/nickel transport system permease protein